jgi:protein-S-isoprenylcysteine O-methyltransferase Ste14
VALALFVGLSLPLVAVSWRSLRRPRSHGFPRFFAFEAIVALVILNAGVWFADALAPRQLLSWLLLAASALLAIHGFVVLRTAGRPARRGAADATLAFENTSVLVTRGAYRWIRHPLYASLLLLAWGAALKRVGPASIGLAVAASLCLVATAKADERECLGRFGDAYRAYMARTRMFVPYLV